jgi:hypothetical protein
VRRFTVAWIAAALCAWGCESPRRLRGQPCDYTSECGDGLFCVRGYCRVECRDDRDCAEGSVCASNGESPHRACQPPRTTRLCFLPSDCPTGSTCVAGACRQVCQSDLECAQIDVTLGACVAIGATRLCARPLTLAPRTPEDARVAADVYDATTDAGDLRDGGVAIDVTVTPPDVTNPCTGVDFLRDPANCGSCGVRCAVACVNGACRDPRKLVAGGDLTLVLIDDGLWYGVGGPMRGTTFPWPNSLSRASRVGVLDGVASVFTSPTEGALGVRMNPAAATGELRAVGINQLGRLGNGTPGAGSNALAPVLRAPFGATGAAIQDGHSLSIGTRNGCAVVGSERFVLCWGDRSGGAIGDGDLSAGASFMADPNRPVQELGAPVTSLRDAAEVRVGDRVACARTITDGAVLCWGANGLNGLVDGALGIGLDDMRVQGVATRVELGEAALSLDVSGRTVCALTRSRRLLCWGSNRDGMVGDGSGRYQPRPVDVGLLVDHFSMGMNFVCAREEPGALLGPVRCWGRGTDFRLAGATSDDRARPTPALDVLGAPLRVRQLAAGSDHACALDERFGVRCWGLIPADRPGGTRPFLVQW